MCPNFANYFGSESQPEVIGSLIPLKPTSITVIRDGAALAAQTVRLETLSSDRQMQGQNGRIYSVDAMALGYKGHSTQPDCDLQAGDTFEADEVGFEVIAVMPAHTDCLQAYLRVRS
jgi:hypothetical protein